MIYNVMYGGELITEVDIPTKELANYEKTLKENLPKASLEIKDSLVRKKKPQKK